MKKMLILVFMLFTCYSSYADKLDIFYPGLNFKVNGDSCEDRYIDFYQPSALDEENIILPMMIWHINPNTVDKSYACTSALLRTTNKGLSWDTLSKLTADLSGSTLHFPQFDKAHYLSKDTMRYVCSNMIVRSSYDGGKTWDSLNTYPEQKITGALSLRMSNFPNSKYGAVICSGKFIDSLYYTIDNGNKYHSAYKYYDTLILANLSYNYGLNKIIGIFRNFTFWGDNSYSFYVSKSGVYDINTKTWTYGHSVDDDLYNGVFISDNIGFMCGKKVRIREGYKEGGYPAQTVIYKTTDEGMTWNKILEADSAMKAPGNSMMKYKNGMIYIQTHAGLIISTDKGNSWKFYNVVQTFKDKLKNGWIMFAEMLNEKEFILGFGNPGYPNLYKYTIEDSTSAVTDETDELINVYPNPANNIVNISAPEDITSISLMDMSGLKLNTDNFISGKNAEMKLADLPSGVYFLNITCGNKTYTRKIVHTEEK